MRFEILLCLFEVCLKKIAYLEERFFARWKPFKAHFKGNVNFVLTKGLNTSCQPFTRTVIFSEKSGFIRCQCVFSMSHWVLVITVCMYVYATCFDDSLFGFQVLPLDSMGLFALKARFLVCVTFCETLENRVKIGIHCHRFAAANY